MAFLKWPVKYPPGNGYISHHGKFGKSSTQKCLRMGYVSSQQGIFEKTLLNSEMTCERSLKRHMNSGMIWNIYLQKTHMNSAMTCEISRKKNEHELWKEVRCVHHVSVPRGDDTHVQRNNDSPQINFQPSIFPPFVSSPFFSFVLFSETEGHKKIMDHFTNL